MIIGKLIWNIDPITLYADLESACLTSDLVKIILVNEDFFNYEKPTFFLVINLLHSFENGLDAIEVLVDDRTGWIIQDDFKHICLTG